MNWLDLAMIALATVSLVSGIREGLSRSGFGFLAVCVALLSAAWLYPTKPVGFVLVFGLLVCAGAAGAFLLGRWFDSEGLKWLDGVLGGAFGLANAVLVSVAAVLALMAFAPGWSREYVGRSTLAPYAIMTGYRVVEVVPDEMKARIEESYRELGRALPPKFRKALPPSPRNKV